MRSIIRFQYRVLKTALQLFAVTFALAQTACDFETTIRSPYLDRTAPDAATALVWTNHSDQNFTSAYTTETTLKASWVPSNSTDSVTQKIQFYSDADCAVANGAPIALSSVSTNNYTFAVPGDGTFSFRILSSDRKGNQGGSDCASAMTVDTVSPTIAITVPANNVYINIASDSSNYQVSGTCSEEGRTVTIKKGTSVTPIGTALCTGGTFNTTVSSLVTSAVDSVDLTEAIHVITATIADLALNSTTSSAVSVTRDVTAPIEATSLAWKNSSDQVIVGTRFNQTIIKASWVKSTSTDIASQTIQLYSDAACTANRGSALSLSVSATSYTVNGADGETYSYRITNVDQAGNVKSSACSGSLELDTVPPTVAITVPANNAYINISSDSSNYQVSGTCSEEGRTVTIKKGTSVTPIGTALCSGGTFNTTVSSLVTNAVNSADLTEATHAITATIADLALNSTTSSAVNVTRDVTAPNNATSLSWRDSSGQAIVGTRFNQSAIKASWTLSSSADVASQKIQFFAGNACQVLVLPTTNDSIDPLNHLSSTADNQSFASGVDGTYTFKVTTIDHAGNATASACSGPIEIDTAPPTVTITSAATWINNSNKTAYTVTGACGDVGTGISGGTVTVTMNDGTTTKTATSTCTIISGTSGTFTTNFDTTSAMALADGISHITVTASVTDVAGSTTTVTQNSRSRDTSDPTITLTSASIDPWINLANQSAYTVTGTCDDVTSGIGGQNITVTITDGTGTTNGTATGTTTCTGATGGSGAGATGTFTTTINTTTLADTASGAATGNISIAAQVSDVSGNSTTTAAITRKKDAVAPTAQVVFASNNQTTRDSNSGTVAITATTCADTSKILITSDSTLVPNASTAGWANCVTIASNYSVAVASPVHGTSYGYKAWAIDESGNISTAATALTFTYDNQGPTVNALVINGGNAFTGTPVVTATVTATDDRTVALVRVKEADLVTNECQSQYADDSWQSYAYNGVAQDYSYVVSSGDGTKYLCAWAKDAAGNVTSIPTPSAGSSAKSSIQFSVGNPPKITSLSVLNNTAGLNFGTTKFTAGDQVRVAYSVTDIEGLDNNPISISYTTDNAVWKDVVSNLETTSGSNQTWFGAQAGNPTAYSGQYLSFNAPVSTFFRIKVVAKDLAGNTSVAVLSDSLNTPNWSIYAGSDDRGVGGTALTASLYDAENYHQKFAIHPKTNDIYAVDYGVGIKKIDAKTGLVSLIIKHGATNLSTTGGAITSSSLINTGFSLNMQFDANGLLYILVTSNYINARIYQINIQNMTSISYIGGGTAWDATSTPSTASVLPGMFGIDESNSIYYMTGCNGTFDGVNESPMRLMKVTQNADATPGVFSVVAGDCTNANGSATGPFDAVSSPLVKAKYNIGSITVWNHGQNILFAHYFTGLTRKIINGQNYASNIASPMKSLAYNPVNQKIYSANGSILEYTLGAGANGDTYTEYVSSGGTGDCLVDGVLAISGDPATKSCVNVQKTLTFSSNGTLFFEDGPGLNADRDYRIRYKDSAGKVRTLVGALPFFGDGLDKGVIRGKISGIHYKPSTAPNQAAFPEALYFTESKGMVMGKINPVSGLTTVLAGTQQGNSGAIYSTGTSFDRTKSLMNSYSGGNGMPLAFDSNGLPWFRYLSVLASVNSSNQFVARQIVNVSGSNYWEDAPAGADPKNWTMFVYGGYYNLTLKNDGIFLYGVYSITSRPRTARMFYFDFGTSPLVSHIMNSGTNGVSADVTTPGSLTNVNLSNNGCFSQYRYDQDRLYFSEETKLRYITAPNSGSNSTLISLFTQPDNRYITNFIFSPDQDMIFYLSSTSSGSSGSQTLHCHDISSGKSWCNDSPLSSVTGLPSIYPGANQLTWRDNTHLLISTYRGYVLEYTLQP